MKKRSLFAAVAMLIVSAIVLTSATYAWFAANETADVAQFSASVVNADGSVLLQATQYARNADFGYSAEEITTATTPTAHLTADNYNPFLTSLNPVSIGMTGGNYPNAGDADYLSIYKVGYDGTTFSASSASPNKGTSTVNGVTSHPDGDYIYYGFNVIYNAADTTTKAVYLKPTIAVNASGTQSKFGYVLVRVKPVLVTGSGDDLSAATAATYTDYLYAMNPATTASNNGGYTPLVKLNTTIKDAKTGTGHVVDVVDATDTLVSGTAATSGTDYVLGTAKAPANFATSGTAVEVIPSGAPAGTLTAQVEVYIWAEGNDPDCTGAILADYVGIKFDAKLGAFA